MRLFAFLFLWLNVACCAVNVVLFADSGKSVNLGVAIFNGFVAMLLLLAVSA